MANPTMVYLATTKTFRAGNIQAKLIEDTPRQRKLVSSDGTSRIIEVSTTDERMIEISVVALPLADDGSYAGYTSLRTFLLTTVNWAENTFALTDADGDSFTVRLWSDSFSLSEEQKDVYEGTLLFRVEPA